MLGTLKTDPKKQAKVKDRIAKEIAGCEKSRSKGKWDNVVFSHLWCVNRTIEVGLSTDVLQLLDRCIAECRATPQNQFKGMLSFYTKFGTMGGIVPELERMRKFYGDYYGFLSKHLGAPGVRYAQDLFAQPVVDPGAATARGTNLLLAAQVITSQVFSLGGTMVIGPRSAGLFLHPQAVTVADEGSGRAKTVAIGAAGLESVELVWKPDGISLPGWFSHRLPDLHLVRINTPDGLFDLFVYPNEAGSITSGTLEEKSDGDRPTFHVSLRETKVYGALLGDEGLQEPQKKLMAALHALKQAA